MTHTERDNLVGRTATLRTKDGWDVLVTILDAREAYGRLDVLVTDDPQPYSPDGARIAAGTWVSADRVKVKT